MNITLAKLATTLISENVLNWEDFSTGPGELLSLAKEVETQLKNVNTKDYDRHMQREINRTNAEQRRVCCCITLPACLFTPATATTVILAELNKPRNQDNNLELKHLINRVRYGLTVEDQEIRVTH